MNTFKAADRDHNTEIDEEVIELTKKVRVQNKAKTSRAFIRVRFEVSPSDAVTANDGQVVLEQGTKWKDGGDGFYYFLAPVNSQDYTDYIIWKVADEENIKVDTFDVLVYEESCVATSLDGYETDDAKLEKIKEAFQTADGKDTTK